MLRLSTISTLLLAACAPQNAEVSGNYIAFFSEGSSLSLTKEEVVPEEGFDFTYNLDCREFETNADEEALRLEDPISVCGPNVWPPVHEEWALQAGFRVVGEQLEPWRGEAVITAEGDLQIGFHHRLPSGADMRFIMSVNPTFQPTKCEPSEGGGVKTEPYDGDWLAEWSKELDAIASLPDERRAPYSHLDPYLDGGTLYFLNAFGYQLNPRDIDDFWNLPEQWLAGAAQGKIAEELIFHRTPRYGDPFVYNFVEVSDGYAPAVTDQELWFCDLPAETTAAEVADSTCMIALDERVQTTADEVQDELARFFQPDKDQDPLYEMRPITHMNYWRDPDGLPAGFDGWGEMHYNYIVFDKSSTLEVGGSAEGGFTLVLDAVESSTRVFVKGTFVIDKIRKDRWTTADLRAEKAEENNVEICFD